MQFPGQVFQAFSPDGPQVFIPPNMLDEVKAFPDNVVSMTHAIKEVCLHKGETDRLLTHSSSSKQTILLAQIRLMSLVLHG
jgi:hypothetical protein